MENLVRMPIPYILRKKNSVGKELVFCEVSGRYMTIEKVDFKDFL